MNPPVPGTLLGERFEVSALVTDAPGYREYRARDRDVDVEVALWWMRPQLFADPQRRDALVGAGVELRALADPALRKCYGVGRGTGGLWTLWQLATAPPLIPDRGGAARPLAEVRRWLDAVARGLAALHAQGLVHGRMVPSDVVSVGGVLKLGGGGVWRDLDPVASVECWSAPAPSVHYLAPEVRHHQPASPASDVWSLATIALELIAGVAATSPDCTRAAARRHPSLAAVLVGATNADPGRRPDLAMLAEAVGNAGESPYLDAAPRGKAAARGDGGSTVVGHASGAPARARTPSTRPPPVPAPKPLATGARTHTGVPPKPGAFAPKPETFALPTPTVAPPAPRPSRPAVAVVQEAPATIPTPARVAIAGAIDRARTAPPGEFVVAAVSMKREGERTGPVPIPQLQPRAPVLPEQPKTGDTPHVQKAKIRGIAEVMGGRKFSTAPGQMGYLAPPKAVSDARNAARGGRRWLLIALIVAGATAAGVTLAILL